MRTLLRHTSTHLFYLGPDKWTDNPDMAFDFRLIDRAVKFVGAWRLKEVELAFVWTDPGCVRTVPLAKAAVCYREA